MNPTIKYNLAREEWDEFIAAESLDGGLLQSWNWGEFQKDLGRKIFRLSVFQGEKMAGAALVVKQEMPLGFSYLYLPRGPVVARSTDRLGTLKFLFAAIRKIASAEKSVFFRLDPPWPEADELAGLGLREAGQVQPKSTLVLDLDVSEDELLEGMKPKTRYNIKLAQKHGITVSYSDKGEKDFEIFWDLMKKTSERDAIKSHSKEYYRKMLKLPQMDLVFASFGGKIVAANIMATSGQWRIYLHGASDYDFRDKMGPYLLQWRMIQDAKAKGCRQYDFWGADSKKWPGVTRFKSGFAPDKGMTVYCGAYDEVYLGFFYRAYNVYKKLRK